MCAVQGQVMVCVCISQGIPQPMISWRLASHTDYSVTHSGSVQTVKSTIIMSATEHNTTIKCVSSNKLGQDETDIPLQNNKVEFENLNGK